MCQDFDSAGIKPIIILQVNVLGNHQPLKPVKVSLPIPADLGEKDEIMIFHSEDCGGFKDVTNHIPFIRSKHHVHLTVLHFTR